jgi:hypothetical protein
MKPWSRALWCWRRGRRLSGARSFGDDRSPAGSGPDAAAHRDGLPAAGRPRGEPRRRTAPERFLIDLGQQGAGIRPGRFALIDLARDGRNIILGRGFKRAFDDGTRGQVRHFVGVARASMFGGSALTRWISENLRRDPAGSPDGRLADEGIDFAQALLAGRLELSEASEWIRETLCKA